MESIGPTESGILGKGGYPPDPRFWVALGALATVAGLHQYFKGGSRLLTAGLLFNGTICLVKGVRERKRGPPQGAEVP